jgi:hypothetical protein
MSNVPGASEPVEIRPWQTGLAPVYIGAFLWIAFFDQIGRRTLPVGGLIASLLGCLLAGPLGYLGLFRAGALWGHRTGRNLSSLATSTFGVAGSRLVPDLLIGLGQVVWFAVAIGYGVELTFDGLVLGRWISPGALRVMEVGGATLRSPLFLGTALVWSLAVALVSLWFVRLIAAIMQYFPVFPALMLGGMMLATLGGLRSFQPTGIEPITLAQFTPGEGFNRAFLFTFQWVFAFSAMAALFGADWGVASPTLTDVKRGGWVGMGLAPVIIGALGLISVAGYEGSRMERGAAARPGMSGSSIADLDGTNLASGLLDPPPFTARGVIVGVFDRRVASTMLLTFGLASLAPAVYAAFVFGRRFAAIGPSISPKVWTCLAAVSGWLLVVGGWFDRTETIFNVLGGVFAPVAGAIAADAWLQKGGWKGARAGFNPPGMIAWLLGASVGVAPSVARFLGYEDLAKWQPASLFGLVVAYFAYVLMAKLKLESRVV